MASYSMPLRTFIEQATQNEVNLSIREKIEKGRKKLFDFDYPIFDPNYKAVFETHFIRRFYMREIGFETEELFKFQLETWLIINMPYFNKMFESELIDFDPLMNSEMQSDFSRTKDTDGKIDNTNSGTTDTTTEQEMNGSQNNDRFSRKVENDTPDNRLTITTADGSGVIEYASKIEEDKDKGSSSNNVNTTGNSKDVSSNKGNTTTDITETESYLQKRTGKIGSITYSKMLMEYRDSLIRIENKMFDEMNQLFMLVY